MGKKNMGMIVIARCLSFSVLFASAWLSCTVVQAASSIYHSAPDNVFGWCAGYAAGRANRCAEAQCRKHGGSVCRFVAGCNGSGAIAFPEGPFRGFGAACLGDDQSARRAALIACMSASNTVCWTNTTFSSSGRSLSPVGNRSFDQVWFAQLVLQSRSIYSGPTDGTLSEATGSAVAAFQQRIGRLGTGAVDEELVQRLLDAIGGPRNFAATIKRDLLPFLERKVAGSTPNRVFYAALEAAPTGNFSQYLMTRNPDEQRLALATFIASRKTKCTVPARSVSQLTDDIWSVTCDEATYTVVFSGSGSMITGNGQTNIN